MVEGAVFRGKAELLPKLVVRFLYSHLCSKKQTKTVSWVVSSSWVHFVLIDNMIYYGGGGLHFFLLAGVLLLVVVV